MGETNGRRQGPERKRYWSMEGIYLRFSIYLSENVLTT